MSIRKASARTTVNSGITAAAAATVNLITTAPATATTVAGGGTLGGVTISNISIMSNSFANAAVLSGDTAVSSSGGFVRITGTGFKTNANVFLGATLCSNTFVSSTQINANIPASSNGTYQFYVFNTDGSGVAFTSGLVVSGPPTWTTTSYTASALNIGAIQLLASGDAPLTYYIQPGSSNPQNLVVNSAGYLSGTVASEGAYTITVIVDDAQNQSAQADITLTVTLSEPYFKQTTLLLSGDGTNNANNISFVDASTNTLTITRNGGNPGMSQGTFTPFSQTGWSGYFTGATTSYIATPTTSILNQGQTYTVQCWIYPTSFTTSTSAVRRMYIFIFGVIYAGLSIHSDGTLGWYGWPTPAGMIVTSAAGTITTNEWQHVALVINPSGNSIKLFKNGVEVGSAAYTAAGANNSAIQIGHGDTSQATDGFIGYISNFKVTLSALTGAQLDYSATPTISSPTGSALLVLQTNRFNDTSANAFSITNGGVTSIQAFSPFAPAAQYSTSTNGGSAYFDGNGDWLSLSQTILLALGTGDFTWESWIYLDITAIPSFVGIYDQRNGTNGVGVTQPTIELTSTNGYAWYSQASNKITSGAAAVRVKSWQHLAVCRSSGTTRMFLDGAQVGSNFTDALSYPSGSITIGRANDGVNTRYFTGYFSDMRVIKGTALYTGAFTPPTAPLTAVANTALLLNFTNAGVFDATGKNTVETVADAKISTAQSKFGGSSIAFDGTGDWLTIPHNADLMFGTGNFTIEMWVYRNSSGTYGLVGKGSSTTGWLVSLNTSNQVVFTFGTSTITSTGTVSATTWTYVTVVREGTGTNQTKIYINGNNDGTGTVNTDFNQTNIMYVGADRTGGSTFNGYIDDLRITKGFARYTANFTAPTSNHKLR